MFFKLSCIDSILNCMYFSINMNRFYSFAATSASRLVVLFYSFTRSWCHLRLVVLVQQAAPAAIFQSLVVMFNCFHDIL